MAFSTICLLSPGETLAGVIGREIRRRRLAAGLSQAVIAFPYSRALVCSIEHGRAVPSLAALAVLLGHLDVEFDEFFRAVQSEMTMRYTPRHGHHPNPTPGRRR